MGRLLRCLHSLEGPHTGFQTPRSPRVGDDGRGHLAICNRLLTTSMVGTRPIGLHVQRQSAAEVVHPMGDDAIRQARSGLEMSGELLNLGELFAGEFDSHSIAPFLEARDKPPTTIMIGSALRECTDY